MRNGLSRLEELVHVRESFVLSALRRFVKGWWGRQGETGEEQNYAERIGRTLWRVWGMELASSILTDLLSDDHEALSAKILGDVCACPPDLRRMDPDCVPL